MSSEHLIDVMAGLLVLLTGAVVHVTRVLSALRTRSEADHAECLQRLLELRERLDHVMSQLAAADRQPRPATDPRADDPPTRSDKLRLWRDALR